MAKPDPKRDYYEDMELKPSATDEDIKRQFRKLAMIYHPDRNPGKEMEFNAKFQAIQSAHEVLVDPAQRAKYDSSRIRAGLLNSYTSPTAPDLPPRSYTNFAPPPRRPPTQTTPKQGFPASPTAPRYPGYPTSNPDSYTNPKDDAQARANAFSAWQSMKSSATNTQPRGAPKNPRAPRPESWASQPSDASKNTIPKPQRSWERATSTRFPEFNTNSGISRSNTTRMPRKPNGFIPTAPGGDEPSTKSNYRPQAPRTQTQWASGPPPPPPMSRPPPMTASTEARIDPLKSYRSPTDTNDHFVNTDRLSTPYASVGGEKTYFSSEGLSRTASNSGIPPRTPWPTGYTPNSGSPRSPAHHNRHHSASPKMRSPGPRYSESSDSSSSEEEVPKKSDPDLQVPGRRASHDPRPKNQPVNNGNRRPGHPSSKLAGEDSFNDHQPPQHRSTWDAQSPSGTQGSPRQYAASQPTSRRGSPKPEGKEGFYQHRAEMNGEKEMPKSPLHKSIPKDYQNGQKPLEKSKCWQDKYGAKEDGIDQRQFERPTSSETKETRPMYAYKSFPISPVQVQRDLSFQTRASAKKENATTPPWPYWAIPSSILPRSGKMSGKKSFHPPPFTARNLFGDADSDDLNSFSMPNAGSASSSPLKSHSSENINLNFSSSGFPGTFNADASGSSGHYSTKRVSPNRPLFVQPNLFNANTTEQSSSNAQMPQPPPMQNRDKPPSPTKFSEEEWTKHFKESSWAFPPLPPAIPSPRMGNMKRQKSIRKLSSANKRLTIPKPTSVSATAHDAREEEIAASDTGSGLGSRISRGDSSGSAMDVDSASSPPPVPVPFQQPTSSAETEPSRLDLNDLKKAAPFAPSDSGLNNIKELDSALPFESRPSAIANQSMAPQNLALPNPPKAPMAPAKLDQDSWEYYMIYMKAYMVEWNVFNRKMLDHFNKRQIEVETKLGGNWIASFGDEGYARYMKGVEEDFRVRGHWDISFEKHREYMRLLGKVRKKAVSNKLNV